MSSLPKTEPSPTATSRHPSMHVERVELSSCVVSFGHGVSVLDVMTGFESLSIIIPNAPASVTIEKLEILRSKLAGCTSIVKNGDIIRLQFDDHSYATNALPILKQGGHCEPLHSARLQLNLLNGSATFTGTLYLSWQGPFSRLVAVTTTPSAAFNLTGRWRGLKFRGRSCKVYRPSDISHRVVVHIDDLPVDATREEVCSVFTEGPLSYLQVIGSPQDEAEAQVTAFLKLFGLHKLGRMKSDNNSSLVQRWAEFSSYDELLEAERYMRTNPLRINEKNITSSLSLSTSQTVRRLQYTNMKEDFLALLSKMPKNVKLQILESKPKYVRLNLKARSETDLILWKSRIDHMLAGELWQNVNESQPMWSGYFTSAEGKDFLSAASEATNTIVMANAQRCYIRISGTQEAKERVKSMITAELKRKSAHLNTIPITKAMYGILIKGALDRLKTDLADVSLNLEPLSISCTGGEKELKILKTAVQSIKNQATHRQSNQSSACPICLDDVVDPLELTCSHRYCISCLRHYISSVSECKDFEFPMRCVAKTNDLECLYPLPLSILRRYSLEKQYASLHESSFMAYIRNRPNDFKFCPTPDCGQIYRIPAKMGIRCPSCITRICTACYEPLHEGLTCEEQKDTRLGGDRLFQQWLQSNTQAKNCPTCKMVIVKDFGCNHMKCFCGTDFCWVCLEATSVERIYDHMTSAHGGIGL